MRRRRFLGLAASALLPAEPGIAAAQTRAGQLAFARSETPHDLVLDYRLADYAGHAHRISFRLPLSVVDEARRLVPAFSNESLADDVEAALRRQVERFDRGVNVVIERQPRRLEFTVHGATQAQVDRISAALNQEYERAEMEYFRRNYMVADDSQVFIDYARVVARYQPVLRPVSAAIAQAVDGGPRERLALALAFVQTIPYDELLTRDVESGFDFVTPPILFVTNKGDCDSKAVALAAMLRSLIEGRRMLMVLLPNHAVLGVEMAARAGEHTMAHQGRSYLLLEPAGPAPYEPGALFPDSAKAIAGGRIARLIPV